VLSAAVKEATETSSQTTKEAASGDQVAQKLLAKQAAAVAARGGGPAGNAPAKLQAPAQAASSPGSIINERA